MIHIFIVNPQAGYHNFSDDIRNHLKTRTDIEYFVFNTRKMEPEAELVKKIIHIFEGEELRIYSCGGSGTFRNIMGGIQDIGQVELAFVPYGETNDFLKIFGDKQEWFQDLDKMIDGVVVPFDYIETNHGRALNSLSYGLDSNLLAYMEEKKIYQAFGKQVPYLMGMFYSIFMSKPQRFEIVADGIATRRRTSEVFFMNGGTLGGIFQFEKNYNARDGKALFGFGPDARGFGLMGAASALITKDEELFQKHVETSYVSEFTIKRVDGQPFEMDLDGEITEKFEEWKVHIVPKGIKLVVPKGVVANE